MLIFRQSGRRLLPTFRHETGWPGRASHGKYHYIRNAMLRSFVNAIDAKLRKLHGVVEFTNSPDCIFRIEVAISKDEIILPEGTHICAGERLLILHLWNEQMPAFPAQGPTIGWALRLNRALKISLVALERYLSSRPDLADINVIKADMALGAARRSDQLVAFAARYGFQRARGPQRLSFGRRLHRLGENILISMLVLLHNPGSFRADTLRRACTPIFLSRTALRKRGALMAGAPSRPSASSEV